MLGDTNIAAVAEVLADRSRCRLLMALADGRALPASHLAAEAGIAASTTSAHLGRLLDAGMLVVEPHGRHRYYRLAGSHVGELIEAIARLAPPMTVRSLREGTKAAALRRARACYDHLAGRLGVALMDALLAQGLVEGGDGIFAADRSARDRASSPGWDVAYVLSERGHTTLESLGIDMSGAGRRPFIRYCVDWSEQRHHLAGELGARMLGWFEEQGLIKRQSGSRALIITEAGAQDMGPLLGIDVTGVLASH